MSYEGFEQHICKQGHFFETGISGYIYSDGEQETCPYCESVSVWVNCVDDTNCDEYGVILEKDLEQLTGKESGVCNLGHTHVVSQATYRVPSDEEACVLRKFRNSDGEFEFIFPSEKSNVRR